MMKRVRKLMNKQDGMTLVEVIVALVLFVFVFMILLYGINSALKVMGNANAINNATQSDASKLETLNSSLESSGKATLTPLGNALKITEDGKTYTVAGQFKVATTQKTNDQTDLSLTYFDSKKAAATKPVPTVGPVPTTSGDKAVVVPDPGTDANKDNKYYAYYSPDGDNTIMSGAGVFQTWLFNHNDGGWSAFYYGKYGSLTKGVTTESYLTNENTENPRFEYLQQLYFINNEPFKFQGGGTQSGIYGFYLNFLYVGTTDADTDRKSV
ncbi:MAG: prepilin-type N-terminal cleavage/methylation domain-containing protein, partial [Eubacteriaceae bacterium]|nr:prepilin-type N-terminal cleavage/methylation domain-containing protein [Eubacteriaceae bacterium]